MDFPSFVMGILVGIGLTCLIAVALSGVTAGTSWRNTDGS